MKPIRFVGLLLSLAVGLGASAAMNVVRCALTIETGHPVLSVGDRLVAKVSLQIAPGFHIASLTQPEGGTMRTTVQVLPGQFIATAGEVSAPPPKREHSEVLDADLETYEGSVTFVLPLKVVSAPTKEAKLRVKVSYQACSKNNCLQPAEQELEADLAAPPIPSDRREGNGK